MAWRLNSDMGNSTGTVLVNGVYAVLQSNIPVSPVCSVSTTAVTKTQVALRVFCSLDWITQTRINLRWIAVACTNRSSSCNS
jgi:hypothetical protein